AGAHRGPDLVGGKPAILEEAGLSCTLAVVAGWRHPEAPAAGVAGDGRPVLGGCRERRVYLVVRDAPLPQVHADADRPVAPAGVLADELLEEPRLAQQSLGHEARDHGRDNLRRV